MPIQVVNGPPFSGKDATVRRVLKPGEIVFDTTPIWKAFKHPSEVNRSVVDAQIANSMKRRGLDVAVEQGRDGYLIVAERDPIRLKRWLDAAGQQKAWLVTEPMDELLRRARKAGPECEELLTKWDDDFENDPEFTAITEPWSEDAMRTIHDIETQYRAAVDAAHGTRRTGSDVQCRCLTVPRRAARRGWRLARGVRNCRALRRRGTARPGSESV